MKSLVLVFLLAFQSPQLTPQQIIDQITTLLGQLKATLTSTTLPVTTAQTPATGADLIAALKVGGTITLKADTTYTGNFVVSKPTVLTGGDPLTTILAPQDMLSPTLQVLANDVTVTNLQLATPNADRETLVVGDPAATSVDAQPHRIMLTKLTMNAKNGGHRGMALHGADVTVDHCTILNYYLKGQDSQGIAGWNGPGPFTITNNTIEASGENILFGGADPTIPNLIPSNILIQGNLLRKPDTFRTLGTVKNSIELKNAQHVKILGNTISGWWHDGQDAPIQFTVRNQDGHCLWCLVDDVLLQGNTVHSDADGFAVNILGSDNENPSAQTNTITIDHNLFVNAIKGVQVLGGVVKGLTITHNTWPGITYSLMSWGSSGTAAKVMTPLTFTANIAKTGSYGISGDGSTVVGLPSLLAFATLQDFSGNIIEMTKERTIALPLGNTLIPSGGLLPLLDPSTFKLLTGTAGY